MKTKIVNVDSCENIKCSRNWAYRCQCSPEIDNHMNCLSCSNRTNFKLKKENICERH